MERRRFRFHYRARAADMRRHPLGRGSMVIHNVIKHSQARAQLNWHNRVGLMRKVVVTGALPAPPSQGRRCRLSRIGYLLKIRRRRVP